VAVYVALLRGINVGTNNRIRMPDLRACFEAGGFDDVATYIQSGNVVFEAVGARVTVARTIEALLADRFGYPARIVLRSAPQMRAIVRDAPPRFGARPTHRYDVVFLREPLTAAAAMRDLPARGGVDDVRPGRGVLYAARPTGELARSRLTRLVGTPIYESMTIRNWRTTTKLLAMMDARRSGE
jgi:uncharacterized protein (DUF1697 family)